MPTWRTVLSLFLLHLLAGSPVLADRKCYYPGGAEAPGYLPCSDDESTHCCNEGSICMTNKLCLNAVQPYTLARGACTNQKNINCSSLCKDIRANNSISVVLRTEDPDNNDWSYCCGELKSSSTKGGAATCANGMAPFVIDWGYIMPGRAALLPISNSSDTTHSNSSSTFSSPSSSSATAPSSLPSKSNNSNRDVAIGAGVGVPLGIIAAAAIAWGIWERMQRRKVLKTTAAQSLVAGSIAKSDVYMPGGQDVRAGPPAELEQRDRPIPELAGSQRT